MWEYAPKEGKGFGTPEGYRFKINETGEYLTGSQAVGQDYYSNESGTNLYHKYVFHGNKCFFSGKTKYPDGGTHPIRIHKMVNGIEHPIFKLNKFNSSVITRTITNISDNVFVSFVNSEPNATTVRLYKNNNIYETLDIIRDDNNVITNIVRKRDNVIVESYSLSLSNNEYLITDNITNNLIKITFDSSTNITSITFGKNNTLLNHSTITFSNYLYYTLVEKSTGQFTYLHKNADYFDYSFNELGEFSEETLEQINSDRSDSWKLRKKISLNYNPIISAECSYIQNGFFNNGLSSYSVTKNSDSSVVNISSNSDTYLSKIIGENDKSIFRR